MQEHKSYQRITHYSKSEDVQRHSFVSYWLTSHRGYETFEDVFFFFLHLQFIAI